MKVSVIILNWNGFEDTSELLLSLREVRYPTLKIFVVDNHSSGNDAVNLEDTFKNYIKVISSSSNLGFTGGNNLGIKKALEDNTDYILLLNNDTTVRPDFLEILVNKFTIDSQVGIVAPRINYYDEQQRIWTDGGKISRIRGSGFAYSDNLETEAKMDDKSVAFVSGCCMLIKREVFLDIGLFDENYFLYVEDTDLCLRTIRAGYKIYVVPRAKIFHKVNKATKKKPSSHALYYVTRNRLYFTKKNFGDSHYLTIAYLFLSMAVKSLGWILLGRLSNIVSVYRAFKDFFNGKMGKVNNESTE
jgi:GT2 family glycosyltransferase